MLWKDPVSNLNQGMAEVFVVFLIPLMPRIIPSKNLPNNPAGFYVLLTVHLGIIFVNNQLEAQFFIYVYFYSIHVSGSHVPIIMRINCINTTSGVCHSV